MKKSCPPGVFCIENYTLLLITIFEASIPILKGLLSEITILFLFKRQNYLGFTYTIFFTFRNVNLSN